MLDRDADWLMWHLTGLFSRDSGIARLMSHLHPPKTKPTAPTTGG